jgi:hypothetical protein
MDLRQSPRGDGSKQLRQLVSGTAHFLSGRAFRRLYADQLLFGKLRRALLLLLASPGTGGLSQPSRPGLREQLPKAWGTARFNPPVESKKRRSARCPRVAALVQLHPPKPPPRPAGGSHCLKVRKAKREPSARFSFLKRVFYLRPVFCGKTACFSIWGSWSSAWRKKSQ